VVKPWGKEKTGGGRSEFREVFGRTFQKICLPGKGGERAPVLESELGPGERGTTGKGEKTGTVFRPELGEVSSRILTFSEGGTIMQANGGTL